MRTKSFEIRDQGGDVVESGALYWWNNTITLEGLYPHPTAGIGGMVGAVGGWCAEGRWSNPIPPVRLQCTAARWAGMLAAELGVSPEAVINGIASVLEKLEDERLLPPAPVPIPPDEVPAE